MKQQNILIKKKKKYFSYKKAVYTLSIAVILINHKGKDFFAL